MTLFPISIRFFCDVGVIETQSPMPQFISEAAMRTCESPTESAIAELVIQIDTDHQPDAEDWIVGHDGDIVDSLESGLMEIKLPEIHLSELCDQGYVNSVEHTDESIKVLTPGN
jgi:hypothetical protein